MSETVGEQILSALKQYTDEERHKVKEIMKKGAIKCRKDLKKTSPEATLQEKDGKQYYVFKNGMKLHVTDRIKPGSYKKGWSVHTTEDTPSNAVYVIANKRYQLTHLLEDGHANRDGTRTEGDKHISECEQLATAWVLRQLEGIL